MLQFCQNLFDCKVFESFERKKTLPVLTVFPTSIKASDIWKENGPSRATTDIYDVNFFSVEGRDFLRTAGILLVSKSQTSFGQKEKKSHENNLECWGNRRYIYIRGLNMLFSPTLPEYYSLSNKRAARFILFWKFPARL